MEIIYNTGPIAILKDSGMTFAIYNITLNKPEITIIGSYLDKNHMFKRITKDSKYGKIIMGLLNAEPEPLSRDAEKIKELLDVIVGKMDINKVGNK
jgi:tRNA G37 N-methylase Trm5